MEMDSVTFHIILDALNKEYSFKILSDVAKANLLTKFLDEFLVRATLQMVEVILEQGGD